MLEINKNKMKKLFILFTIVFFFAEAKSQHVPLYTQYQNNPFTINPATAGSTERHEVHLHYRAQWIGFPGAPQTSVLSYQGGYRRIGWGLIAFNDEAGSYTRSGYMMAYAYHIPLFQDYRLSIGVSGALLRGIISLAELQNVELDNTLQAAAVGTNRFDGNLGVHFYNKELYVSLSAPNLIQTKFDETQTQSSLSEVTQHFFALVGYRYQLNKTIGIEPSVLVRKVQAAPFQVEGNLKTRFALDDNFLVIGGSYKTSEKAVAALFGVEIENKFMFYYGYDFSMLNIRNYNQGSHEITLGVRFGNIRKEKTKEEE
jgi:type IX secretion system PorP/SprF family membrane protein